MVVPLSGMDTLPPWTLQWLERTLPYLQYETFTATLLIALLACYESGKALKAQLRARKLLKNVDLLRQEIHSRRPALPIDSTEDVRELVFVDLDHQMAPYLFRIFQFAIVLLGHLMVFWLVDGGVCAANSYYSSSKDDGSFMENLFATVALVVCAFAVLFSVFLIAPMLQTLLVTCLLMRLRRRTNAANLAGYVASARILTTQMAFFWMFLTFFINAWWSPVSDTFIARQLLSMAATGSAYAWLDASYAFNFCPGELSETKSRWPGLAAVVRLFAEKPVTSESSAPNVSPAQKPAVAPEREAVLALYQVGEIDPEAVEVLERYNALGESDDEEFDEKVEEV